MGAPFQLPSSKKPYSNRGGAAAARKFKLLIDGNYMTTNDIAEQLGLTIGQVTHRIRREQSKDGPLTLAGIGKK